MSNYVWNNVCQVGRREWQKCSHNPGCEFWEGGSIILFHFMIPTFGDSILWVLNPIWCNLEFTIKWVMRNKLIKNKLNYFTASTSLDKWCGWILWLSNLSSICGEEGDQECFCLLILLVTNIPATHVIPFVLSSFYVQSLGLSHCLKMSSETHISLFTFWLSFIE